MYGTLVKTYSVNQSLFKNSSGGGGVSTKRDRTILSVEGVWGHSLPEKFCIFPLLGLHFVRFLKQIICGYTVLHYTADRPNLQLSTCMVYLCKYQYTTTRSLTCLGA